MQTQHLMANICAVFCFAKQKLVWKMGVKESTFLPERR